MKAVHVRHDRFATYKKTPEGVFPEVGMHDAG